MSSKETNKDFYVLDGKGTPTEIVILVQKSNRKFPQTSA